MPGNIKIIIHIKPEPGAEIIGIKEDFATYCEKFGDVVKVDVEGPIENYEQRRF